jgi:hypothetical protein
MEKDLDDLLDRAKFGHVSRDEITWVAEALRRRDRRYDLYRLIHIIGLVGAAKEHEEVVADFLSSPDDPMLSRISVITLDNWGLFNKYYDVFLAFSQGVDWDDEGDVRIVALTAIGKHLATNSDCRLLASLIDVATDDQEDVVVRRVAFNALATAMGAAITELPAVSVDIDFQGSWASRVLGTAKKRYQRECGERAI